MACKVYYGWTSLRSARTGVGSSPKSRGLLPSSRYPSLIKAVTPSGLERTMLANAWSVTKDICKLQIEGSPPGAWASAVRSRPCRTFSRWKHWSSCGYGWDNEWLRWKCQHYHHHHHHQVWFWFCYFLSTTIWFSKSLQWHLHNYIGLDNLKIMDSLAKTDRTRNRSSPIYFCFYSWLIWIKMNKQIPSEMDRNSTAL